MPIFSTTQVIDFGSSCYEHQRVYTYIQSRFYRAPEVILGVKYGMAIDMWSLGCILAELYTGCALLPGEDEFDQLACIIELLGMPPKKLLEQSKRVSNFFTPNGNPRYCIVETLNKCFIQLGSGFSPRGNKERKPPGKKELTTALKGCDDLLFIDFLQGCLEWDPESRMTPAAALKHPWFRRRRLPMLPPPVTSAAPVTANTSAASSISLPVASGVQQPVNPVLNYLPKQHGSFVLSTDKITTMSTGQQQQQQHPANCGPVRSAATHSTSGHQQSIHVTPSRNVVLLNEKITPSRTIANQGSQSTSNASAATARSDDPSVTNGTNANGSTKPRLPIASTSEESMATAYSNPRYYQRNESIGSNGSTAMSTSMTTSQHPQQPLPRHPSCDEMLNGNNRSSQQQQHRSMHLMDGASSTMTTSTISNSGPTGTVNNGSGSHGLSATTKLPHIQTST